MIAIKVLERLLEEKRINLIGINLEQIEELINEEVLASKEFNDFLNNDFLNTDYHPSKIEVFFRHDWDGFMFWQPMNWRNFTWFKIYTETNNYSKYLELSIAILGFHFELDWFRPHGEKP